MAKIVKKNSLSIKGVLNVNTNDNKILVEIENDEPIKLADLLQGYDGSDVSISVNESVDIV